MNKLLIWVAMALLLPIGVASAADPPDVKEGLWSVRRQVTENPGDKKTDTSSTICRSHAYDKHVLALARGMKGCTVQVEKVQGSRHTLEVHCVIGATTIDTKGATTFQGDTAAHSESRSSYSPAMAGISEMTLVTDQKYLGACPAGVQPGDMTAADGKVSHLWKH